MWLIIRIISLINFVFFFFFFNDTATTEIYTLSLHDALPLFGIGKLAAWCDPPRQLAHRNQSPKIGIAHAELQSRRDLVCRLLLEKKKAIRSLDVSFKPEGNLVLQGDDLVTYGYPDATEPVSIILDTGSELPRKVKAAGLTGVPMPIFRSGDPGAVFMQ